MRGTHPRRYGQNHHNHEPRRDPGLVSLKATLLLVTRVFKMSEKLRKFLFGSCLILSMTGHLLLLSAFGRLGPLELGLPVRPMERMVVDLNDLLPSAADETPAAAPLVDRPLSPGRSLRPSSNQEADATVVSPPPLPEKAQPAPPVTLPEAEITGPDEERPSRETKHAAFVPDPPLRSSEDFLGKQHEKLVYRINLLGLPVGIAELEATNETGGLRISLRIRSDEVLSALYPVDDLIETRHINGNFILTRIRQREGSFRSDRGFTIFLRDRHVFWIDRMTNRSLKEQIPNSDVTDLLSGLYFLRNRPLQIGVAETLHIYDSDSYAAVPVEVVRRETVSLPAFREVEALMVQPRLKTGGIFRFTGDLHIWLSNDQSKVPVKIVTSIPLGQITAELVSSEGTR